MPGTFYKQAGVWTELDDTDVPSALVGGTWKAIKEIHVKSSGAWVRVWPPVNPPTPTNMRFGTTQWINAHYEVQTVWDPVQSSLFDGYELEITRVGGPYATPPTIIDTGSRNNFITDVAVGETGGIVVSYRVRSYKSGYRSPWSPLITTTTPGDAGFCRVNFVGPVGDVWGKMYCQLIHDGNPNNVTYDMVRTQVGKTAVGKVYTITGGTMNCVDQLTTAYYSGSKAGSTNTADAYSDQIAWNFYCKNAWGKQNNQSGSPYGAVWGFAPFQGIWRLGNPGDKVLRINAASVNTYRRQPSNSVGWVGGVPRCGGNQGDMETVWFFDKNIISDLGIGNRIRAGQDFQHGLGRRNDGGNLSVTFSVAGAALVQGQSGAPGPLTTLWYTRTWQRGQGELFTLPRNWSLALADAAQPQYGSPAVYGDNTANTYAEFGYPGEIIGGVVNGQLVIINNFS